MTYVRGNFNKVRCKLDSSLQNWISFHPSSMARNLLACLAFAGLASALENGLARTPPMGWSTFNRYQGAFNETIFKR